MRCTNSVFLALAFAAAASSQEAPPRPETPVWARLRDTLSTKTAKQGDLVFASIESPPFRPGSWAVLRVSKARQPGMAGGRGELCLKLERFQLPGAPPIPGQAGSLHAVGSTRVAEDGCVVGPASVGRVARRSLKWALVVGGIAGGLVATLNSVNIKGLDPKDKRSIRNGVAYGGAAIGGALVARSVLSRGEHLELQAGEQMQLLFRAADLPKTEVSTGGDAWKPPAEAPEKR